MGHVVYSLILSEYVGHIMRLFLFKLILPNLVFGVQLPLCISVWCTMCDCGLRNEKHNLTRPAMISHNFKEKIHAFVYETVSCVLQTFIGFRPYGFGITILKYASKEKPPLCVHMVRWDWFAATWSIGIERLPELQGTTFTRLLFRHGFVWVTSLHHIHCRGINGTSLVKNNIFEILNSLRALLYAIQSCSNFRVCK